VADIAPDIFFASISELNAKLRAKEFSCRELTQAFCDRMERIGPRYNALALSLRKQAMSKAKDVDRELKRDRTRGPLQGIPYGAKDLLAVKKQPTTWGAKPYAAQVFDYDARVIEKLDSVGAILIAKLSMVELAGGGDYRTADASLTGPGLNPWDPTRWSGGSSSGPGSAVAAGLATFAIGSETSGSILTPSAFCGVTGLRPTYGLVSRSGAMALSWTLDKLGPMCRSAEDCALVLHEMAGGDSQDPGSAGRSFNYRPQDTLRRLTDLTIGYVPVDFEDGAVPAAQPALRTAFEVIKSLGAKVKEIQIPEFPYGALVSTIIAGEAGSIFEDLIRSGKVDELADPHQIAGLKAMLDLPATEYLRAMRVRSLVKAAFHDLFLDCDMVLAPSRLGPAPKAAERLDTPGPPTKSRGGLIPGGNLAGLPALSLPCGFAEGLPVAISLLGRPFYENQLVTIGNLFQKQTDWHRRRPPVEA
jgi:Asp-tRNA(Asn)/Glu-tRNA(Gln) amidotransferase A subunit family amidase